MNETRNTLLINFKRHGDIFMMGHVINDIKSEAPETKISILIFKEFLSSAKLLTNVDKIHTIDRKKILTLRNGKPFSDIFALKVIEEELQTISKTKWDTISNISNDKIATYIIDNIKNDDTKINGIHLDSDYHFDNSSEWDFIYNEILPCSANSPIHFVDLLSKINNVEHKSRNEIPFSSENHTQTVRKHFNLIKENYGSSDISIIGIQFKSSTSQKDIDYNQLANLTELILNNSNYFPVLLISPSENEREIANQLNKEFSSGLTIIESDFLALSSILQNLDLLITPDTSVKHLADLCKTPLIEVCFDDHFRKQGTCGINNIVLAQTNINNDKSITALDMYCAIELQKEGSTSHQFSPNVSVYKVTQSDKIEYNVIAGEMVPGTELDYTMYSSLLYKTPHNEINLSMFTDKEISHWILKKEDEIQYLLSSVQFLQKAHFAFTQKSINETQLREKIVKFCSLNIQASLSTHPYYEARQEIEKSLTGGVTNTTSLYKAIRKYKNQLNFTSSLLLNLKKSIGKNRRKEVCI